MGQIGISDVFFENPTKDFQIRGIAKSLKIPKTTVSYHINNLLKKKLIVKNKKGVFPSFRANEDNELYRFYKRQEFLKRIIETTLLDYIEKGCNPKCIILFGSFAKAEYDKNSDIDLFIQAKESKIHLINYEKKLKHKINVLFESDIEKLSPELLNNIVNGVKLRGYLKIK